MCRIHDMTQKTTVRNFTAMNTAKVYHAEEKQTVLSSVSF